MPKAAQYQVGQRWAYKPSVVGFENTLVIGEINEAMPGWGRKRTAVYIRFSPDVKDEIPADYDGVTLILTDAEMNRTVRDLVESEVQLPWWWTYGRRFDSQEKARDSHNSQGGYIYSRISDLNLAWAKERLKEIRSLEKALRKHSEKFGVGRPRLERRRSVTESWKRIEAWYAENAYPLTGWLAPGASEAAIKKFEYEVGVTLPHGFKESVRVHDGGGWWVPWEHGDLLSLEAIHELWRTYCELQIQGEYATDEDTWIPEHIKGPIKAVFWNKRRIYVTDNSGEHLTLDLDPPPDGKYGQVVDHSHELGPTEVVASSWAEFLAMLVQDLEGGKFVHCEDRHFFGAGVLEPVEYVKKLAE